MAKKKQKFNLNVKAVGMCLQNISAAVLIADNGIRWWKRLFKILLIVVLE